MVSVIILVIKLHVTEITSFLLNYIVVPVVGYQSKKLPFNSFTVVSFSLLAYCAVSNASLDLVTLGLSLF